MRAPPGLALAFALALACAETVTDRATTGRVDTLTGGRVEVANAAPAWAPDAVWRLEEDLRLGSAEAEGPESERFGSIWSVASDTRGRIYVLDATTQEVRVFHRNGAFSHAIGGKGGGPGEFVDAYAMTVGPGDTLWVTDGRAGRYSAFSPDGEFVRSHRRDLVGWGWMSGAFLPDGSYLDWGLEVMRGTPRRDVFHPILFAPGFVRPDSLPPIEYVQETGPDGRPRLFFAGTRVIVADRQGGVWFADPRDYRIYRRALEGDTTLVFSVDAEAAPVGEAERSFVRKTLAARPSILAAQLEALPETRPMVHGIVSDGAGHLFVFADVAGAPAGTVVDVFREDGEYMGRMRLPTPVPLFPAPPSPVAYATPEHLLVVVEDELDVAYVSRLRIIKPR